MRNYESIIVFDANLSEEQLDAEIAKVQAILQGAGSASVQVEKWGRKDISYAVKGSRHGHFVLFRYGTSNPEIVNALRAQLAITENVRKYYSVRINLPKRKFKGRPLKNGASGMGGDEPFEESELQY